MITTKLTINGRYKLEEELGCGAFGVAYLARDTRMHSRPVVIKLPLDAEASTFDRDIKALARINHPGVVQIYDHGWTPEGQPFIVMQYLEGESLSSAMRRGGMELKRAARIVSQLGSALSAVHKAGVIHRDLKPENVMLRTHASGEEDATLIDFGVATVEESRAGRGERDTWAGTPLYMAPEQLRGRPVPASDVWSLGVVAYEMVTGRRPFSPDAVPALIDAPRAFAEPKTLRPELPRAAQDVILKALNYDPALRYARAYEMGEAFLSAVNAGEAPTLPPNGSSETLRQTTKPAAEPLKELLRRCRELFEPLDEFRRPDVLRAYLNNTGLTAAVRCVKHAEEVDFDRLLSCLLSAGRDYRGQSLIDLLAALAAHYRGQWQEQKCEALMASLKHALEPAAARGE
jgi:serine/threonine protein kinase